MALERSIADLGYYAVRVTEAERAAMEADPELVKRIFHDKITHRVARVDGPRGGAARGIRRAGLPDARQRRRLRDRPDPRRVDLLPQRQRAGRGADALAPAGEHGLVLADTLVDASRAPRGGVPGPVVRAPQGSPRSAPDDHHDPRPAVRLRPRYGPAALAGPPPDRLGRRPAARPRRLDRRAQGDRDLPAGPRRARAHPRVRGRAQDRRHRLRERRLRIVDGRSCAATWSTSPSAGWSGPCASRVDGRTALLRSRRAPSRRRAGRTAEGRAAGGRSRR